MYIPNSVGVEGAFGCSSIKSILLETAEYFSDMCVVFVDVI